MADIEIFFAHLRKESRAAGTINWYVQLSRAMFGVSCLAILPVTRKSAAPVVAESGQSAQPLVN
jgi:hypothetical protein